MMGVQKDGAARIDYELARQQHLGYPGLSNRDWAKSWYFNNVLWVIHTNGSMYDPGWGYFAGAPCITDSAYLKRLSLRDGSFEDPVRPTASTEYIVSEIGESTRLRTWYQAAYNFTQFRLS